jgi:hypothetical protein
MWQEYSFLEWKVKVQITIWLYFLTAFFFFLGGTQWYGVLTLFKTNILAV